MRAEEALKCSAQLPPEDSPLLLSFIKAFRDWTQYIVDQIWAEQNVPSLKTLHQRYYEVLRKQGFRAHHVKQIYKYARIVVKATKKNRGSKHVLRKLTARLDKYDYKLDLDKGQVVLKGIFGKDIVLKLKCSNERLLKFKNWKNYELVLKYEDEKFWAVLLFSKEVPELQTDGVLAVDLNFDNITYVIVKRGRAVKLKRLYTPLRKALTHKVWQERIQKRYPKSWKYVKGIREAIRKHGRRSRNILNDWAHKVADFLAEEAKKYRVKVVLEDLNKLRNNAKERNKWKQFRKKLAFFAYHRVQSYIEYEAKERGVLVLKVNPKGTSSRCPVCGAKLKVLKNRTVVCSKCGYIGDRDVTACLNLARRGGGTLKMWVRLGSHLNAPNPMQPQGG